MMVVEPVETTLTNTCLNASTGSAATDSLLWQFVL